jgi:exocyst complex protein 7
MEVSAAAELEAAERVVMRWDSSASAGGGAAGGERAMLFDVAVDRAEAERFPRSRLAPPLLAGAAVQIAMARLEDELRHVLATRTLDLEIEALSGLTSLSMAGDRRNSNATDAAGGDEDGGGGFGRARRRRRRRSIRVVVASCRLLRGRHL